MNGKAGKGDAYRPVDGEKYTKNFMRMIGMCDKCKYFRGKSSPVNKHCGKKGKCDA